MGKARAIAKPEGLSGTQTPSGRFPRCASKARVGARGCTNIELPLWSERGLRVTRTAAFQLCNLVAQGPRDAKGEFKREVERELTLRETEAWEIIYFKLCKNQIPVIEQAIATAALMLRTDIRSSYSFLDCTIPVPNESRGATSTLSAG